MHPRIGTSGWSYSEWRADFYKGVKSADYLAHYASQFDTVEINNSFYRFPRGEMFAPWVERTPKNFLFAVKMWRGIVHGAEVRQRWVGDFFKAIDHLGDKLGPILFQMPPHRIPNRDWLETVIKAMPKGYQYVFELRDQRWLTDDIYEILHKHNVCNCFYDFKGFANPEVSTASFAYIRLHGPNAQPYTGGYSDARLRHYADVMAAHRNRAFIYMDNTASGHAIADARTLLRMAAPARRKAA